MSHPRLVEGEVRVIGHRWSPCVHEIKEFLARSGVPFRWLEVESDGAAVGAAERARPAFTRFPVVLFRDGSVLEEPDVRAVAQKLGLETRPEGREYDLVVVGAGPAGLTASIHGASEGLRTVVVEQEVPGGQAGHSALVENYPGFPRGLSGSDLARRTLEQAERFGVEIVVTRRATRLRADGGRCRVVTLDDGTELAAHAVLLAIGATFRWLDAPGARPLVGARVYYGAATAEASACRAQEVYVLGGGNSAGQAALVLARHARRVTLVALEDSLAETMSAYLVERLGRVRNVAVRTRHTVAAVEGNGRLERLTLKHVKTGETERVPADTLFVFIGAAPRTEWLAEAVVRDGDGFILCGPEGVRGSRVRTGWPLEREPYEMETCTPGVFVAGDVRRGSVKRIASAVGEGARAVQSIHRYLRDR
ncbi:MAG TPA: FAD-dependent oxidoreductase [Longimicrobiaceae bacterium]|nr:FAD-dependent oxidoreductase [Longimicrobiaceae bacterium]